MAPQTTNLPPACPGVLRWVRQAGYGSSCPVWRAHFQLDGLRRTRDFSVNRYGEESAHRRAVRQRRAWERLARNGDWSA